MVFVVPSCVSNKFYSGVDDYVVSPLGDDLIILQLNIRIDSLNKFNNFLSVINNFKSEIGVIVISETWLKYGYCSLFNIPGYDAYHSCRCGDGGGLSLYVLSKLKHQILGTTDITFNYVQVELITSRERKLRIAGYY